MSAALVPELAVRDWSASRRFYCEVLGFEARYDRAGDGFSYLVREGAELMIDQIGLGRDFDGGHLPDRLPFGRGVNLQIRVSRLAAVLDALATAGVVPLIGPEDRWYRRMDSETGNRQIVVPDPDGYLLRFFEDLGTRPAPGTEPAPGTRSA